MRLIDIVLRNLRRRKARCAFVIAGLAISAGTVVGTHSMTAGIEREIGAQLDQYGANIVIVPRFQNQELSYGGLAVAAATFDVHVLKNADIERIKSIPYASRLSIIAPKLLGTIHSEGQEFVLAGVDFEEERRMKKWWHISGKAPNDRDELLLGYESARRLGVVAAAQAEQKNMASHTHESQRVSEIHLLRSKLALGDEHFPIAGVLDETGGQEDRMIFAALSSVQRILGKPGDVSLVEVSALCVGCPIDDIVAQISAALPGAKVSAVQQAVRARMETVGQLSRFSTVLSVVMIVVSSLLILVTLMASVIERTKEIGVLRALGFRRWHVIQVFLLEAAMMGFAGGVIGWAVGTVSGVVSLRHLAQVSTVTQLSPGLAVTVVAGAMLIAIASSIYPALKASRLDPMESLRYF